MALLPVEEALARILKDAKPAPIEPVALLAARGRVLAETLLAGHDQPPFTASAMDGYAVRTGDVAKLPARLTVVGEAAAGRGWRGMLAPGQAVRIFTGAPLPDGADAIVIQENTRREGGDVLVTEGKLDPAFVRRRAFDFAAGERLLGPGLRLGAREITLAAAMGHDTLPVRRRPRVAILATGDELVLPGTPPGPDQIVCSNPFGVAALAEMAGGEPVFLGIARDDPVDLDAKLAQAAGADILVTIGGASVGDHDLVAPALRARGLALDFWNIAMRPGKPLMYGTLERQQVLGLPGNPVSALICGRVFLVPLIQRMLGSVEHGQGVRPAIAAVALEANGPRQHYARATLDAAADTLPKARPVRSQDSSLLSPLATAQCLIVRPPNAAGVAAGGAISILPLDF